MLNRFLVSGLFYRLRANLVTKLHLHKSYSTELTQAIYHNNIYIIYNIHIYIYIYIHIYIYIINTYMRERLDWRMWRTGTKNEALPCSCRLPWFHGKVFLVYLEDVLATARKKSQQNSKKQLAWTLVLCKHQLAPSPKYIFGISPWIMS